MSAYLLFAVKAARADAYVYPDEDHGFFRSGPKGKDGSRDVWPRVQAFLTANL